VGNAGVGIDEIVTLDHALAGESDAPVGLGVVAVAGLSLGIVVVVIILNSPVNGVMGNVGLILEEISFKFSSLNKEKNSYISYPVNVGLAVRGSGGDGNEGKENNGDLGKYF